MKFKLFMVVAVIAVIVFISGTGTLATASPASSSDPLVTLDYLNGPFRTAVTNEINSAIRGLTDRLTAAENDLRTGGGPGSDAHVFTIRNLATNDKLTIAAGSEVMVESGTVNYTGNLTKIAGSAAGASSGALDLNNMYLATGSVELTAANAAKVWVRNGEQ